MNRKTLRKKDGFTSTTPWLRSEVRRMQLALREAGFSMDADGFFGSGTEQVVKTFQEDHGLSADGLVAAKTWAGLDSFLQKAIGTVAQLVRNVMPDFHGDLDWVHMQEGHVGKPYWPAGKSGVTLDPGVDLGYADPELVKNLFGSMLSHAQWQAVEKVFGINGAEAKAALKADLVLQGIRISRKQADEVMPFAAKRYWRDIVARFPSLADEETLPAVQTVMLSLSYNRGPGNRGLEVLAAPLAARDWAVVRDEVGTMQQDHSLEGIRRRRRWEAALIDSEI